MSIASIVSHTIKIVNTFYGFSGGLANFGENNRGRYYA